MMIEVIKDITILKVDMIATTAVAGILLMMGQFIRQQFPLFERLCLPAPVIGGLPLVLIIWLLRSTSGLQIEFDITLQLPFMLAFFACVGLGGSFRVLKKGGRLLIIFLVACWGLSIIQNIVGVGLASALKIHPILGIMAGTVSLAGGHGNAAAFGPVAENFGVHGATTVAIASATFGLITGSLFGGPVGDYLIRKYHVPINKTTNKQEKIAKTHQPSTESPEIFSSKNFLAHLTLIFCLMFGGLLFSHWVDLLRIPNFALPNYVGAMFLAILFRNLNDKATIFPLNPNVVNLISEVGLAFFLTIAMMTLKIWELVDLALSLIIILCVQLAVLIFISIYILFPLLGKNYDAAIMTSGYTGWGMGISATAIVCMSAITEKYNQPSPQAFLVVPLCGAVFVDAVAIPSIIFFMSLFA